MNWILFFKLLMLAIIAARIVWITGMFLGFLFMRKK